MNTKITHAIDNTLRFADFAPAFCTCPCRACPHRLAARVLAENEQRAACARFRAERCGKCPVVETPEPDAA